MTKDIKYLPYDPLHIYSKEFQERYVPAAKTDIAQTFARIKAELAARDTQAVPIKRRAK
jgi:hypothetical protein